MQLSIYIKKTNRVITADTLAMVNGDATHAMQLDAIINGCKPVAYALMYGLTQSVNDAHANVPDHEKAMAAAEKKLSAILAGTVKVRGATRTHANPIMHEAMKIARAWWKAKSDTKKQVDIGKMRGKSERFAEMTDEQVVEEILVLYANLPDTQGKAEAIVAANSIKVEDDFDLDDVMPDEEESEESDDE